MKKWMIGIILLTVSLTLVIGYFVFSDTAALTLEPLSDELKTKIRNRIILAYDDYISWDVTEEMSVPYYGTINDCIIIQIAGGSSRGHGKWGSQIKIAGYAFETPDQIQLYAYRNGEACTLEEAYERGWLTKWQIGKILERHNEIYDEWIEETHLYRALFELDGEKFERIISSSESKEDAVEICTKHFTNDSNTVIKCEVVYESDLLYGIYVRWEHRDGGKKYEENVISFKKNVADLTMKGDKSYRIITKQKEKIEKILLYLYFDEYSFHQVRDYEMSSQGNAYIMTIDAYYYVVGDWGVADTVEFLEQTIIVDRTTGKVTFNCERWATD